MKKMLCVLLAMLFVCSCLAGCGAKPAPEQPKADPAAAPEVQAEPAAPEITNLSIGGAGTSGTFYIMGAAYADLITKNLGINAVCEVTAGSVENVVLMADNQVELGVVQLDVTLDALNGTGSFDAPVPLKVVAPMYPNVVQIVTLKDSDINTFADLKGKRVSVGSPGSGILATNEIIFQTLGMDIKKDINPQYLSFAETTDAFRNNAVDAVIVNTAAPSGFLTDLETTHELKFVTLSDEEIAKFTETFPFYVEAVVPGGTYKTIPDDYKTFAVWIALMGREDLPEQLAYDIAKTLFENQDALKNVHAVASYLTMDNAKYIQGVEYHPGTLKYLQEHGVELG